MFETMVTVVGNVLNAPECRRIVESQQLVTHFKVASTSRRYERAGERWVDGDSLRVRVNCWRHLAENVARSVQVGDPVIVTGRLYSRDWQTEDHVRRVSYELDAHTVGHDLTRGRSKFARVKPQTLTSAIDDELADARIGEAPTSPADEINGLPRRRSYDEDLGGYVTVIEEDDPFAGDVLAALDEAGAQFRRAGFDRTDEELAAELEALANEQEREAGPEPEDDQEPETIPEHPVPVTGSHQGAWHEPETGPESDEEQAEEAESSSDPTVEEGTVRPPRGRQRPRSRVTAGV